MFLLLYKSFQGIFMNKINPVQYNPFVASMYSQNAIQNSQPLAPQEDPNKVNAISFFGSKNPSQINGASPVGNSETIAPPNAAANYQNGKSPAAVSNIFCGELNGQDNYCGAKLKDLYA